MELTGRLGVMSLGELLQWPHNDRRTGSLVVRTARREKRVLFDRGSIVGCLSGEPAEYFGQHLLLNGYLERDRLMEALGLCRAAGVRLGAALVDLGLLSPQEAARALARHVEERVCDLFIWPHGVFYFQRELPAGVDLLSTPLDPIMVALEGTRWADEHARIREVMVHDGVVVRRTVEGEPLPRPPLEARILASLDEPLRLDQLYRLVQGSQFRFLEATYALLVGGALDVEGLDEEAEGGSEIRVFDLLLEQAATEEVLFSPRHLSLPLEWLDRFFPLWVETAHGDGDGDRAALAPVEAEFYRAMDGSRSLRDLVMVEPARRQERMDLVLLQLQKGQLALLPRPLSELQALGKGAKNPWLRRFMG